MSSLLDYTIQGDVGTVADESKLPQVKLTEAAGACPGSRSDRPGCRTRSTSSRTSATGRTMDEELREEMLWGLWAFFVGEERVTSQFSGLVLAAEDKNEEAFLLTRQVDEARHAQHFNRLYEQVFSYDGTLRTDWTERDET